MKSITAKRPEIERDIRELAQAVATLEVIVTKLAITGFAGRPTATNQIVGALHEMADHAVFQRDGCDPSMLDRVADRLTGAHG